MDKVFHKIYLMHLALCTLQAFTISSITVHMMFTIHMTFSGEIILMFYVYTIWYIHHF